MIDTKAIRLCILGHSGVGKSPLTKLFRVSGWEPFRVREPRTSEDAKVCMPPAEFAKLEEQLKTETPLYDNRDGKNGLIVYTDFSLFKVRDKQQLLKHTQDAKDSTKSLRIEIFAPVLVDMIERREQLKEAFALDIENLLIVLLNPTSRSFREMDEPSTELCLATLCATAERSRIQSGGVDLADSLQRVEYLSNELKAWQCLIKLVPNTTVECMKWSHFEFRYSVPEAALNRKSELIKARFSLIQCIEQQACHMLDRVKRITLTPEEILNLSQVV